MFENLIATLKADKRKIVFTEGPDPRILEAASRLKKDGLLDSILVGNVDEVKSAAAEAVLTSRAWKSSTLRLIRKWTRWSPGWSSCARAR